MTKKKNEVETRGRKKLANKKLLSKGIFSTATILDIETIEKRRGPLSRILREYVKELASNIRQSETENK